MTTNTTATLEDLTTAEAMATAEAAKAMSAAQEAAARADAARERAQQARVDARRRHALDVRGAYKERRPKALQAAGAAKETFRDAVIAGKPFGPAFLELVRAEAALYVVELEYAEALSRLGQSPRQWPEPRPVNLGAALGEALQGAGKAIHQDAIDAMKAEREEWIAKQAADDTREERT